MALFFMICAYSSGKRSTMICAYSSGKRSTMICAYSSGKNEYKQYRIGQSSKNRALYPVPYPLPSYCEDWKLSIKHTVTSISSYGICSFRLFIFCNFSIYFMSIFQQFVILVVKVFFIQIFFFMCCCNKCTVLNNFSYGNQFFGGFLYFVTLFKKKFKVIDTYSRIM
jgi:hypothetical protein